MSSSPRKTKGYAGRRLGFIIIWIFLTMFPARGPVLEPTLEPSVIAVLTVITLAIVIIPPLIAARQIYRAFEGR